MIILDDVDGWPLCQLTDGGRVVLQVRCLRWLCDGEPVAVAVIGELSHLTAPRVVDSLAWIVDVADGLVVDLSGVDLFDGGGVALLLQARNRLRQRGTTLVVEAPSAPVIRGLELEGLSPMLQPLTGGAEPGGGRVASHHRVIAAAPAAPDRGHDRERSIRKES